MKKLLLILAALSLIATSALAANEIGIYTTQDANPDNVNYNGAPGQITAYVVCVDPINYSFGAPDSGVQSPISVIGGFEFRVNMPANVYLLSSTMPPQSTNFATPPEWLAGTNAPVVDGVCTLLTMTLGEFSGTPSFIYLAPVQDAPQSIPGSMAITDYNDAFRLIAAFPSSGDASLPVFGLWADPAPVPSEDASWGAVHSLYR